MKKKYKVVLHNKSSKLDLHEKSKHMKDVLNYLIYDRRDLNQARILGIKQHSIMVEVDEESKNWHSRFGNILANKSGMREYCDSVNPERLFRWIEIPI